MDKLALKIFEELEKDPENVGPYEDLMSLVLEGDHELNKELRPAIVRGMKLKKADAPRLFELYKTSLLFDAPYDFDAYMLYLEIKREPKEKFYLPRRKILKSAADAVQDLVEDKLDELFLSMPPRVGKTAFLVFLYSWLIGKFPEKSNLYSAYSDAITSAFYRGVLEIVNDDVTYTWRDVFPVARVVATNAAEETISINRKKRYPSLTARSLYGTLNGACDCDGFLTSDDLIGGIEEAVNPDRLLSTWQKVENNLLTRKKEKTKLLWVGTRWSVADPAGRRIDLLENSAEFKTRRWRSINLPALDGNDESNFDYEYGVGFSTETFRQIRASLERSGDMASWEALYMCQPVERQGTLFRPDEMQFFNGELPSIQPDRRYMAVDPAFGGGDYVSAPVCYQYDEDRFIVDAVFSNAEKETTQLLVADAIIKNQVEAVQFECTKTTKEYMDGVAKILKGKGYSCSLTYKPAPNTTAKETRIFQNAGEIRSMYFLEDGARDKMYSMFMQNVYSFKLIGKNKHDDAPDSLSMLVEMFQKRRTITAMKRIF